MVYACIWIAIGVLFIVVGLLKGSVQRSDFSKLSPGIQVVLLAVMALSGPIIWVAYLYMLISDRCKDSSC